MYEISSETLKINLRFEQNQIYMCSEYAYVKPYTNILDYLCRREEISKNIECHL